MSHETFQQNAMATTTRQPFSNLQLELLKTFTHQLDDHELIELKKLLTSFFAQRAVEQANKVWDRNEWADADVDRLLTTKMRTGQFNAGEK